ncbi:MAG: tetratricopeptide repeat protein [Archaeoglobales archaeon]|nr:tetratricopeptide repeat protein [Archaeoglobales archaeon]
MIEETMREIVRNKILKILEARLGKELAIEVEKKLSNEESARILKEYEKNRMLSEETYALIQSKYCFKDLTSTLFGIPSGIKVYPEITESMIGSGKSGIKGLRKHVRELGYSEDKFEEILNAVYLEIEKLARDPKYSELLATASLELGAYYLELDLKRAEDHLIGAYELRSSLNEQKMIKILDLLVKLCMVYTRTKKTEKAKIVFEKALGIMKELNESSIKTETTNALKELEKLLGKI